MTAYLSYLLCIIGVLIYALVQQPKLAEIGRIMYAAAIFSICFEFAHHMVSLP